MKGTVCVPSLSSSASHTGLSWKYGRENLTRIIKVDLSWKEESILMGVVGYTVKIECENVPNHSKIISSSKAM